MITEMAHAGATGAGEFTLAAIARMLLVLGTAAVAGGALVRPLAGPPSPVARRIGWAAAAVAALACLTSVGDGTAMPIAMAQVAFTLVIASLPTIENLSRWSVFGGAALAAVIAWEAVADAGGAVVWVGFAHVAALAVWLGTATATATAADRREVAARTSVLSTVAAAVVLVSALALAVLNGLGLDERMVRTSYGWAITIETVLVVAGTAAQFQTEKLAKYQAIGLAVAIAAWASLAALPAPDPLPTPGTPLLREVNLAGSATPVLVTPGLPGKNIVHVGGEHAGQISVAVNGSSPVHAKAEPGAAGGWAVLTLPAGRSTVTLSYQTQQASVRADAGFSQRTIAGSVGPDAAECASAALGTLMTGRNLPLAACPTNQLSSTDADSLRSMVTFLASRHVPAITIVADTSVRAAAASSLVRSAAAALQLPVAPEKPGNLPGALVVVSGWSPAAQKLRVTGTGKAGSTAYTAGVWLAPWLLEAPVLSMNAGSILPLRFNPHESLPERYATALAHGFNTDFPTTAGYLSWLAAGGQPGKTGTDTDPTQLYAAAPVAFLPAEFDMHMAGQALGWLPNGTVVPISGPLAGPAKS
ncbi:hypothetical protein GCM10009765_44140 [Fodinicola feengrottensis]|uniref:Uncharacterized protein n=2 Tax=Fodinicola feengrottensis TaxID=435914 RepID=A0ABN2HLJ8_9ACTN